MASPAVRRVVQRLALRPLRQVRLHPLPDQFQRPAPLLDGGKPAVQRRVVDDAVAHVLRHEAAGQPHCHKRIRLG